jgi:hypothetical protein
MTRTRREDLGKFIGAQDKKKSSSYKIDCAQRERSRPELLPADLAGASVDEEHETTPFQDNALKQRDNLFLREQRARR